MNGVNDPAEDLNGDSAFNTFDCQGAPGQGLDRPVFSRTTIDRSDDVGSYSSTTIGVDGLALISYFDNTNLDLKVAHCSNVACTSATTTTIDSAGDVGRWSSITIGVDGLGLISYFDFAPNYDLKVAHCLNVACTAATTSTVDPAWWFGAYTSITIGVDGLGLIAYQEYSTADLRVAHCSNVACTSATTTTIDNTGQLGYDNSITIGGDGLGLISHYEDVPFYNLKVAHCTDILCTAASLTTIDSMGAVGKHSSITTGVDGFGLISYYDETNLDLKVAHCSNAMCSSATISTVDGASGIAVGRYTSITIGVDGLGLISYTDLTNFNLKVAHCSDILCTSSTTATVDDEQFTGLYTAITIGADGLGLISYYKTDTWDLKVAHLSNRLGLPWFRSR